MAEISNEFLATLTGKTIKRADSSTDDELRLEFDDGTRVTLLSSTVLHDGPMCDLYIDVLESTL